MAQGSSNLALNLNKLNGVSVSTSTGNSDSGTQRVVIASNQPAIPVSTAQPVYGLSGVAIVGTSGQFSCTEQDITPLTVGQQITINGTLSGSGSITGYTNPKAYIVSQTNGASTFTLVALNGSAITTSTGTTTGLTFFMRGQQDFNIVGNARENIASINNKLSDGSQKSIVRGGAKGATAAADITSTSIDANTQALDVVLKSAGTNTIGKLAANDGVDIGDVTINNTSIAVTDNGGSLTVDAPIATPVYVRLSNGTTAIDSIPVTNDGSSLTVDGAVSISNFPATQPVSGIVTVSQATAANLNANVTGTVSSLQSGTWNINSITTFPTAITTDTAAIKTSLQLIDDSVGTDGSAVAGGMLRVGGTDGTNNQTLSVTTSGHINIADGGNSITVDGVFWQATQPVSGTVTVSQATAANLNATVTGTVAATQSGTWNVGSITTLPSLPTGTNNIGDVDVASLPGTVASDITAIKTAVELLDNACGIDGTAIASGVLRVGGTDGTNNQTLSVNTSGHLNIADGGNSITVDGVFWQATQPVSIATAVPVTDNGGSITVDGSVTVSNFPVTQAVSIATLPALATGTNTIGSVSFVPNATTTNAPTNASTTAYAASLVAKASAGILYMITGFNSRSSGQFIQVFDSATLPADASVPKVIFYVESNSNFSFDLGVYGRAFSSGIVISNSSTGPTKKIGAADCWFDVQYK